MAAGLGRQHGARDDRHAVQQHRAGAAFAGLATVFDAEDAVTAQRVQQRLVDRNVPGLGFAVEDELKLHRCTPEWASEWQMADGGWQMANGEWQMANGEWRMANGEWRMANGKWQMANGKWQMANGKWRMANGEWRMANGEWRMANCKWQTANRKSQIANCKWQTANRKLQIANRKSANGKWQMANGRWQSQITNRQSQIVNVARTPRRSSYARRGSDGARARCRSRDTPHRAWCCGADRCATTNRMRSPVHPAPRR